MRKCKICEKGNVEGDYYICNYCGWESDPLQEENEDYIGGANEMSFNQYKKFCKDCKNELLAVNNSLEAIKLSIEYYKKNFQNATVRSHKSNIFSVPDFLPVGNNVFFHHPV